MDTHEEKAKKLCARMSGDAKHALIAVDFALEPVDSDIDGVIISTHPTIAQSEELKAIRKAIIAIQKD